MKGRHFGWFDYFLYYIISECAILSANKPFISVNQAAFYVDSILRRCMSKQCRHTCEILRVHVLPFNSYCYSVTGAVLWLIAMPLIPSVAPLQFFLFPFFKKGSCQTDRMESGLNTAGTPSPQEAYIGNMWKE